jgi:hypothetical protein
MMTTEDLLIFRKAIGEAAQKQLGRPLDDVEADRMTLDMIWQFAEVQMRDLRDHGYRVP